MAEQWIGRLVRLEDRVARLERELGLATEGPEQPLAEASDASTTARLLSLRRGYEPPVAIKLISPAEGNIAPIPVGGFVLPPPLPPVRDTIAQTSMRPSSAGQGALERAIGLKWAGWAGAVVLVIGAAFGVQYAYDQGLFGRLPPAMWLALIVLAGVALIGAGEWVYRRVNVIPAASLFGAGVATLFLAGYAGFAYYRLYDAPVAFAFMAFTTFVGALVAMRGRLVSVAMLSLIGGNLTPILIRADHPHLVPFLLYLLALQALALVLACWGASPKWWALRIVALASVAGWMTAIIGMGMIPFDSPGFPLTFVLIYAGAFQLELVASATRGRTAADERGGMPFSIVITALAVIATLQLEAAASAADRVAWVLGIAAVMGAGALVLRLFRFDSTIRALADGFAVQAVGLLVVAVPVGLTGLAIIFGWLVLSIALSVAGVSQDLKISRAGGVAVWMLAVCDLARRALLPGDPGGLHAVWLSLAAHRIYAGSVVGWLLALGGQVVAWLILTRRLPASRQMSDTSMPQDDRWELLAWCVVILAGLTWIIASGASLAYAPGTVVIVAYAWLLIAADVVLHRPSPSLQALAVLVFAAAKWLILDTVVQRVSPEWSPSDHLPIFNSIAATGMLVAVSIFALRRLRSDSLKSILGEQNVAALAPFSMALAVLILLWIGTLEIDRAFERASTGGWFTDPHRAKQAAFSIYWSIFAILSIAAGFIKRAKSFRFFGLGLLGVTLVKVVLLDLAEIGTGYRILSFMGLGLLLLGTSVLYGKLSPRLLRDSVARPSTINSLKS